MTELLTTKLYMPPLRPDLVRRERLRRRLDEGLRHGRPLTLVSAPAGYGKTTLVAAWLQGEGAGAQPVPEARVAWLSLEEDDDEPLRFFSYLVSALVETGLKLEAVAQQLQGVAQLPRVESLITTLLNEVSRAQDGRPLLLVLDDYHKIRTPMIHEALHFWVEHAPPHLQLVLVTREDPPLPLARWRVRNRMTEIRASNLRFTEEEATTFLKETMGLALTADDVAALEARTEGWIAGLQLAAIALQSATAGGDESDAADFIAAFSGSHHYVIDYLVEEVLRQQDEEVRTFLRQTAVLRRLNAPLCNAVTGREDSQALLTRLERENLFLIPLDQRRHWYRYHHLLADSLRAGLDAEMEARLHRRASAWYEANGSPAAAVRHALATGDRMFTADVMERVIQQASAWSRGEVARLTGWLDALPAPLLRARPALSLHASRALYLTGQMERSEQLLEQAEVALREEPAHTAETEGLLALVRVYRAAMAGMRGEGLAEAIASTRQLLASPAAADLHTLARAADTLGLAQELSGDFGEAERAYLQAAELAETAGVLYLAINARCEAALVQIGQGEVVRAAQTCEAALAVAGDEALAPVGLAWAILGEIARERNELAAGAHHLTTGIELSRQGGITDDLRHAYLFLARLRQAQGEPAAALDAWRQADRILQAYNIPRLSALSAAERARLDLAQGNMARANRWAEAYEEERSSSPGAYLREGEELTLARVFLASGRAEEALEPVRAVLAAAHRAGRRRTVIEGLILQAVALQARGEKVAAEESLRAALIPAAREGFVRLFLDEGAPVAALLPGVRDSAPAFVKRLLAASGSERPAAEAPPAVPPPAHLIEPLSEREQEVLALLVAGRSNREIAEALVITVGTAKWHVHNIYQKLDVGSRAEAIARAHEWRLVNP